MKRNFWKQTLSGVLACILFSLSIPTPAVAAAGTNLQQASATNSGSAVSITTQPKSIKVDNGAKATVKVVASGTGLTYKWYFKNPGETKYSLTTTFTGNTYTVTMSPTRSGRYIYCVITDKNGNSVRTNTVSLTMNNPLKITKQPETAIVDEGANARLYTEATGESVKYNWQYSNDSGKTWKSSGVTTSAYTTKVTADLHGRMMRCVVTDKNGKSITSSSAYLLVESLLKLSISKQPQDIVTTTGETVNFTVAAEGIVPHFKWQYSTNGTQWTDLGINTPTCSINVTTTALKQTYRCKIWDDYGNSTISNVVKLLDESQLILSQPRNWVGCASGKAFFEIAVPNNVVSCQWQISSNGGKTWKNSSVKEPYYPTTATAEKTGWLYRCVVQDSSGKSQISQEVSLKTNNNFAIVEQPTDLSGNFEQTVTFSLQASGTNVKFQWQRSDDGSAWKNVAATTPRLSQTIQKYNVGRYYRCVVTNGDGRTLISNVVQLKWSSTGFFVDGSRTYYIKEDGRLASGFETINNNLYYFDANNIRLSGYRTVGNKLYYFSRDGVAAKGFTYVHDVCGTLYFGKDGAALTGWQTINGNTYYFNPVTGAMAWGVTQIGKGEYYFDLETGIQKFGLIKIGLSDYMYFEKGAASSYTGLKTVDGKLYYFAEKGALKGTAQSEMQTVNGKVYYFDPETKQAVTGMIEHNGTTYYIGSDYVLVKNALVKFKNKTYLINSKGSLCYGLTTFQKKQYYLDADTGVATGGWVNLDGSKMYFDPSTYAAKTGPQIIDGIRYYFSSYGYLQTGIRKIDGVRYYCADKDKLKTGFVDINNQTYYVYKNQKVATGLTTIKGKQYYFGTDGIMRTGFYIIDKKPYYFDPDTGKSETGLMQMSNTYTYHFSGTSKTGSGLTKINGNLYCLDSSGIVRYGRIKIDGYYYYFDPATGKALTGWQSIQGSNNTMRKAYFDPKTYRAVTGLKEIGSKLYCFDSSGWVKSKKQIIKGVTYYFSPGTYEAYTGWYKNSDGTYSYFDGANGLLTGPKVHKIDGAYYYIDSYGRRRTGIRTVKGVKMYFDPDSAQLVTGFVYTNKKIYYFNGKKGVKTGLQTIDGNQYYFDKTGVAKIGFQTIGGKKYYFDETTGARKDGLISVKKNGNTYFFDKNKSTGVKTGKTTFGNVLYVCKSSGALRTGYCHKSLSKLGYDVYLDNKTGEQQLGLIRFTNTSGKTVSYYFTKNGCKTSTASIQKALNKALKTNGWHTVSGLKYYVKNGAFYKGKKVVGGKTYYFSSMTGAMLTGLRKIGTKRYYFDTKTGAMKTGLVTIGGKYYYFDTKTGAQVLGIKTVKGKSYYFTENGALTGTLQVGSSRYVFQKNGAGKKATVTQTSAPVQAKYSAKWRTIKGDKYYYNMNGKRVTGMQTIDGKLYYFDSNGKLETGRIKVGNSYYYFSTTGAKSGKITISGKEYYFSPSNMAMLTGIRKIGSTICYYDENGIKQSGWVTTKSGNRLYITKSGAKTGLATIGGKKYYFSSNGVLCTGLQQVTTSDGTQMTCLFDSKGVMKTGLVKDNGYYYYDPQTGARVTGHVNVNGKEYYFDPITGKAKTGLLNIDGVYCYFDTTTAQRKFGLQTRNGKLRYFMDTDKGPGYATGLKTIDGKTYLFSKINGVALTGFQIVDDVKYYFDPTTCASVSGIYQVSGGHAYYFKAGGGIKTGWVKEGNKSYFFYPATGMMAEGLSSVGSHLYYFDLDEGLLKNTTVTVGGVKYQFDQNGHGMAVGNSYIARLINTGIANFDKNYGGESDMDNPDSFSCSQLVMYVYKSIGIDLMRRPPRQYHMLKNGVYDSMVINDLSKAKAGDLIFTITTNCGSAENCDFENEIHHVGIYLGDGKILESYEIEGDTINNGPMIRDVEDGLWSALIFGFVRINGVYK